MEIPPELLVALRKLDTCTIANAIETFRIRLRNEGYCDPGIRCIFPDSQPSLGHAVTVRIRGKGPSMDGHAYLERTDWWEHVLSQPAPRIAVIQDMDTPPGFGSFIGEVHAHILRKLGCVAVVTNGAVRDVPKVKSMGFNLFAGSLTVSHSYAHVVDVGMEVAVGGLKIKPGDWLHGDIHGVLSIPPEIGSDLPAAAARAIAREKRLIELCDSPDFSVERLRAVLSQTSAS